MAPSLLTRIRGNAILFLLQRQKGFRDGDVEGALFFCGLLSLFPLDLCAVRLKKRRQLFKHKGRELRRRLLVDRDFELGLALRNLRNSSTVRC